QSGSEVNRQYGHRPAIVPDRNKTKRTLDGEFTAIAIHAFDEYLDLNLYAGVANLYHPTNELDDGTGRYRMIEVDSIGGHRHQRRPTAARGSDEGDFIEPRQCSTAKERVVVVGGRRKCRFGHVRYGQFGATLDLYFSRGHALLLISVA